MVVDGSGATVVVGYLKGKADFGGGFLTSAGNGDIYLVKYASDGSYVWSQRFGGTEDDRPKGVAVDAANNVVITGQFRGSVSFGGTALIAAPFTVNGFVAKYAATGAHLWSKRVATGVNTDTGNAVATDGAGNVIVAGSLFGTSDFGGGPLVTAGAEDVYIAKFSGSGGYVWARRFGGTMADSVVRLAADPTTGEIAMTGFFAGSADFGGGMVTSAGSNDVFFAKYSSSGVPEWSRRWGNTGDDRGSGVAIDSLGNVAVTGLFTYDVDFGGGRVLNAGDGASGDIFLVKMSPAGVHLWSQGFGPNLSLNEMSYGVAFTGADEVLMTGATVGTIDFGGGPLVGDGWYNVFIAKFRSDGSHVWSKRYSNGNGNSNGRAIAADSTGNVLATGDFDVQINLGGSTFTSPGAQDSYLVKLQN
jgi:hypothetical protein